MIDPKKTQVWLVGGGIASMAAAVFLIRDAAVPGERIHILEQLNLEGGSLDGARSPIQEGYVTRGGRELEEEAYQTLRNLLESIPSLEDPSVSVRQEFLAFNERVKTDAHARLIDKDHRILDASDYGFTAQDRIELMRVLATPQPNDSIARPLQKWGSTLAAFQDGELAWSRRPLLSRLGD
jgi:oleate hydratase